MSLAARFGLPACALAVSVCALCSEPALAGSPGGAAAPAGKETGGSEAQRARVQRPAVTRLSVPRTATAGRPPRVSFRIDEQGVATVSVTVAVHDLSTRRMAVRAALGWVRTGRTIGVRWPSGARLAAGTYRVSLSAHDHHGGALVRGAHTSGVATLTVRAPAAPPPSPPPAPPAPPTPAPVEAGVPTPAELAAVGAVFPVAGAHSYGNPENRFGAPREGHVHQGQDVLTAEGTPIVAPLNGTISFSGYQAGGAGYYAVEHTRVGFDFMFAHCEAGSLGVRAEESVSYGQQLCLAGQTGDATAPHLHFEIWVGGWQAPGGRPIDPLPYLEAWDRTGPS